VKPRNGLNNLKGKDVNRRLPLATELLGNNRIQKSAGRGGTEEGKGVLFEMRRRLGG
jgi:hypothetical protein